jgi:hypothetical protein
MQQVYTTDKGAIEEMPYISMADLVNGKKPPNKLPDIRMRDYERYLATINCFVLNFSTGSSFVEVEDPINDLTGFMMMRNRVYTCEACGVEGTANNDADHTGEACQKCGKPKLRRTNPCDVPANLKRIKSLLEWVKANP